MELPVKYKSQWDADANLARGDCMETCGAMMLSYLYDTSIATWALTKLTGGSPFTTSYQELNRAMEALGVHTDFIYGNGRIEDTDRLIQEGKPQIAIVDYSLAGAWKEDFSYNGPHAVLIIGAEPKPPAGDKFYIINDPDHMKPQNKGKQVVPSFVFEKAWAALGYQTIIPNRGRK